MTPRKLFLIWDPDLWYYFICNTLRYGLILDEIKFSTAKMTSWWRHQMEEFSASLAIYAGNSPVTGEFPAQRPVTRSFDVFFDLHVDKRLSKQSWDWWFETPSRSLWRHCNDGSCLELTATPRPWLSRVRYWICIIITLKKCPHYNGIRLHLDGQHLVHAKG